MYLAVTVRLTTGEVVSMIRWAYRIPYWLMNANLYEDPDEQLHRYIGTPHVRYPARLAPAEGGLIVVDAISRRFLSTQQVHRLDRISVAEIFLDIICDAAQRERYNGLRRGGHLRWLYNRWEPRLELPRCNSLEEFLAQLANLPRLDQYHIDLNTDWDVDLFQYTSEDQRRMQSRLRQMGFELSYQDESVWHYWEDRL